MNITIFNGIPSPHKGELEDLLDCLDADLSSMGHSVKKLDLRNMKLNFCTGCFGCFVKTPGLCVIKDDAEKIIGSYVNSDLVIFSSPVIMGFTSALLKRAMDRLIPILLPYAEIINGEMHHPARYKNNPLIGLMLEYGNDTDDEDLEIITSTYERVALNGHTRLAFTCSTKNSSEEVCNEINNI